MTTTKQYNFPVFTFFFPFFCDEKCKKEDKNKRQGEKKKQLVMSYKYSKNEDKKKEGGLRIQK